MIEDLKEFRLGLGLSQKEFAQKIGVTPNYLSSVECGRLKKSKLLEKKVSRIFNSHEKQDNSMENPITSLLLKTGLSREEIAQKIGVTPNYLYMIESGRKPYSKKLKKLADALFGSEATIERESQEVARLLDIIDRLVHIIENLSGERIDPEKLK